MTLGDLRLLLGGSEFIPEPCVLLAESFYLQENHCYYIHSINGCSKTCDLNFCFSASTFCRCVAREPMR